VYANYALVEDFEDLERRNVSVEGKIVIVRYGRNFRGVKAYLAQRAGAVGVLIYSDPFDDGFVRGNPYPEGPWRPEWGVQRGSVQFLNICPGDPRETERCLGSSEVNYTGNLIPDIPVHPLSWGDAKYLLAALGGDEAPSEWQGGIPNITYNIGPGPARVRLYSKQKFNVSNMYVSLLTTSFIKLPCSTTHR
jgi:N-acetylated-alpha-linked acidic dipeptidase